MVYVPKRRAPRRARAPRRKTMAKKPMTKMVRRIAQSVVNSELETKYTNDIRQNVLFNAVISNVTEFYPLIPTVNQGTGAWQRANNELTPLSVTATFHVALAPLTQSNNLVVTFYALRRKSQKNMLDLLSTGNAQILKNGQSSQIALYNGFICDQDLPLNVDEYTLIHKRSFLLTNNVGLPNGDTTNGNSPNTSNTYKTFKFRVPTPKTLKYSPIGGGTANYPTNDAPFWCIGYAKLDGSAPDYLVKRLIVSSSIQMTFKDA